MRAPVGVGIDGAKATLAVAVRPSGEQHSARNDREGIAALVVWLGTREPTVSVLEATGGYEAALVAAMGGAGLPVAVVNPRQVRACATAAGYLAKTDRLDAHMLAPCAEALRPRPRPLPDAQA
jgi:transposase